MAQGDIAVLEGVGELPDAFVPVRPPLGQMLADPSFQAGLIGLGAGFMLNGKLKAGGGIVALALMLRPDIREALAPHVLFRRPLDITDQVRVVGNEPPPG